MRKTVIIAMLVLAVIFNACKSVKDAVRLEESLREINELSFEKRAEFDYIFVEALKQKMIGNQQRAVSLLSTCLEMDPNSTASMYELANIHIGNSDFTSASLLLERAVDIDNTNKWYKLLLARVYQQLNKNEKAIALFDQLLAKEPDNIDYIYMKALTQASQGKYNDAVKTINVLENKIGVNEQLSMLKQQILHDSGDDKAILAEIQKLINDNPGEARYYGMLADAYLEQGDKANALKNYEKVLQMDPNNGIVHFSLSNYYMEIGDDVRAFDHLLKGFASKEVDAETKMQLILLCMERREEYKITDEKVEELIKILVGTNPDDFRVYTIYADFLIRQKRYDEARTQLGETMKMGVKDYILWEQLLYLDNQLEDWQAMYKHTREGIEVFPNLPQMYFFHALACVQLEKYDEAIQISEEGLMYVVDDPEMGGQLAFIKGEVYYKQGKLDQAFKIFDEALQKYPANYVGMNNYAYYLSLANTDLDKAERLILQVIEKLPDNSTYLDTYAWVLFKKKDYSLARFYQEAALKKDTENNPTLLEHYGDILIMLNRTDEAVTYWQKAKELGGNSETLDKKIAAKQYIEEE
ncbi:MAG: tetratricopeptide repeat protein [Prolixibacteraceae bacterium]|nr:tetratricopeptide repeat protein [Prolixibacteraceae bacterium]